MAFGGSEPLPDIDATVEARVELATASLVAPTAVPLPTYTPVPVDAENMKELKQAMIGWGWPVPNA